MLALKLAFPARRYHATPWDRHVNEGAVEWPPSPWRLLRALLAAWHWKARREVDPETLRALLRSLASDLPLYTLPPAASGHSRHYMPLYRSALHGKTAKVFDTFHVLREGDPLAVIWPSLDWDDQQLKAAQVLAARLSYLGRAESWVDAEWLREWDGPIHAQPQAIAESGDPLRLLAPLPPDLYGSWRESFLETRRSDRLAEKVRVARSKGRDPTQIKLTAKDQSRLQEEVPPSWFEALHAETGHLRRAGWAIPPGSRWVNYRTTPPQPQISPLRRPRRRGARPTVARFAVRSAAAPRLTDAVSVADRVHTSLMSYSDGAPLFSGRDAAGKPLQGHRHVRIFCESYHRLGAIQWVTLYAPEGFDGKSRRVLDRLNRVWGHGGHDLELVLAAMGRRADFAGWDGTAGQCPLFESVRDWLSWTPFVPTRHAKRHRGGRPKMDSQGLQVGGPEHDLRRLLAQGDFPEPVSVLPVRRARLGERPASWLDFRTERPKGGGRRAGNRGYGFRIRFAQPVRGPLALGYGAHFGLGLFKPDRNLDA